VPGPRILVSGAELLRSGARSKLGVPEPMIALSNLIPGGEEPRGPASPSVGE